MVVTQKSLRLYTNSEEHFFHPGMAELRIKNIIDGNPDHMTVAMCLTQGMSVLDCTLGMGTDAIVASYIAGENGLVQALEASPVIAEITRQGLDCYDFADPKIKAAAKRVQIQCTDHLLFLQNLADKSYDIVYFDPMFRRPINKSSGIKTLRSFAEQAALTIKTIKAACRVARQRVVVKENKTGSELQRLGFTKIIGGKYSSICFGVIETGG